MAWILDHDEEGRYEVRHERNGVVRVYCRWMTLHDAMELVHFLNVHIQEVVAAKVRKIKGGD